MILTSKYRILISHELAPFILNYSACAQRTKTSRNIVNNKEYNTTPHINNSLYFSDYFDQKSYH